MAELFVSFVVPTRNSARTVAACLRSIRAQEDPPVELIVVDNNSTDGTWEIASALADTAVRQGPERSAQRNRGLREATGDIVVFIDSDMVLDATVARDARTLFDQNPDVGAAVIPELAFGDGYLAASRALEKKLVLGDAAVEAARIFRRSVLDELGGYDEKLNAFEDYELPDRVRRAGWKVDRVPTYVWHDEGRINLRALFRKKRYYGRSFSAYLPSSNDHARPLLRSSFFRNGRSLLADPLHVPGLVLLKVVDTSGVLLGTWESRKGADRPVARP